MSLAASSGAVRAVRAAIFFYVLHCEDDARALVVVVGGWADVALDVKRVPLAE